MSFTLGSNTFERYRTGAKATADLGSPYIATNEARGFPKGVPDLFITRFATRRLRGNRQPPWVCPTT